MRFLEIIKKYKLERYIKYILDESTSNLLPYHNLYHVMSVVEYIHDISISENIYKTEVRLLVIAALFHDFNHSGGKLKDAENVKNAIKAFEDISEENDIDNKFITDVIKATEYPYVIDEPNIYQEIIRDADLLQGSKDNWIQQIVLGLSSEFKQDISKFIDVQSNFLKDLKFNTKKANEIWNSVKKDRFADIKYLDEIIQ